MIRPSFREKAIGLVEQEVEKVAQDDDLVPLGVITLIVVKGSPGRGVLIGSRFSTIFNKEECRNMLDLGRQALAAMVEEETLTLTLLQTEDEKERGH